MLCPFSEIALLVEDMLGGVPAYGLLGVAALAQLKLDRGSTHVASIDENNAFIAWLALPSCWPYQAGPVYVLVICHRSGSPGAGLRLRGYDHSTSRSAWACRTQLSFRWLSIWGLSGLSSTL